MGRAVVLCIVGASVASNTRANYTYEQVYEKIAGDTRGGRVYSPEVVQRIEVAHHVVSQRQVASLEAALLQGRNGELPAVPVPSRGDVLALTLGDLAERVSRLETTLLSERGDYKRRLDYALAELRKRDGVQERRWWWIRG